MKMAEARVSVDQFSVDQFTCPVCLDLLKDPVTIPCGHSFCMECINGCWDHEDQGGVYSCPQCRDTFTPRPVLHRNNMLTDVVEKLKKTELHAAPDDYSLPVSGNVECDFCTGTKCRAVKSCLVCIVSLCETHLKPHIELPALKTHTLTEASTKLEEKMCSHHHKLIEIYCRTDQSFICYLCTVDEHKGHDTVTAKAERSEKENELKVEHKKLQQTIQEKQKKVQELKQAVINIKDSAQAAVEDSEMIFTEMISSLKKRCSEVTELIRNQEKAELCQTERLLQKVEQEIADLTSRNTELEKLLHTQDHVHFLQSFKSPCVSSVSEESTSMVVNPNVSFDGVRKAISNLQKELEEFCKEEFNHIPVHVAIVHILSPPEPKSREDFLKYFCYLTLDPNTAHNSLILSERNRVVQHSKTNQPYSDHPERFDYWNQVLCKESVCGRCYWEVERSSEDDCVDIAVSYKGMNRKYDDGDDHCRFGYNNQSWSLYCSYFPPSFYHNNIRTEIEVTASNRIGVYVDHSVGTLSFYSVSETMRLLHRVQTTFTDPLYAGFEVHEGTTVRLCDPQ